MTGHGNTLQEQADELSQRYPVGTRVRYWTMTRSFPGVEGMIWHSFTLAGGPVCGWIDSCAGCCAASHMDVIEEGKGDMTCSDS